MMDERSEAQRRATWGVAVLAAAAIAVTQGCAAGTKNSTVLRVATTTSTRDSGLLDELLPVFESEHGCRVDVIAVGTGAALRLGEEGDVDVVLVHARQAEDAFMAAGHGIRHEEFMVNDFVLLGPANDPAGVRDMGPVEAIKTVAKTGHRFVSRGDDSGTHKREMALWSLAGGRPTWKGYVESGRGMGPTLVMADELQGYVLADMGTYLHFQDKIDLEPLAAAADVMRNPYAAIVVDPRKHPRIDATLADDFLDFLVDDETQRRIAAYQIGGQPLFRALRLSDPH